MKLHCLQHVPFEGPAGIAEWAAERSFDIVATRLFAGETPPPVDDIDWLVVMGGPMNIYEEEEYPWLAVEKKFIDAAIRAGKRVLGVCLGAQLIADVIGGKVVRNAHKEIGWFPVSPTPEAAGSVVFKDFTGPFTAFHWHGDTFLLPPEAVRTAESEACPNQAFEYAGGKVVGLQFHVESTSESIRALIDNCRDELVEGTYIRSEAIILKQIGQVDITRASMETILERMLEA